MNNKKDLIIKVRGLSKKYRIGIDAGYKTLTESISNTLRSPLDPLRGHKKEKEIFWALKDVNFQVERGEVVGIIGRNGAGKSTLLKILSRITHPTEGEVTLQGRVGSLLEVGTGFHPELSGRENIYFNGAILGMRKREISDRFDEIVKFAEVEKFLDTPVKRYSSGMFVRLAFAVAAHMDPEILLVDEVLAVGDVAFQKKCLGKMNEVAEGGRTVLFVSHNMETVNELCNSGFLLENGKLVKSGEMSEVISSYLEMSLEQSQPVLKFSEIQDKDINFLGAEILDKENKPEDNFNIFEEIYLCLKYKVNSRIQGVNVALVLSWNSNVVFSTYDTDQNMEFLDAREPGVYQARFRMPVEIMKPGTYSVRIVSGRLGMGTIQDYPDALFFKIHHSEDNMNFKSYLEQREGVVVCNGKWEVKKIG